MKKVIYFDMDGVLADFESGLAKVSEEVRKEYEGRVVTNGPDFQLQ